MLLKGECCEQALNVVKLRCWYLSKEESLARDTTNTREIKSVKKLTFVSLAQSHIATMQRSKH